MRRPVRLAVGLLLVGGCVLGLRTFVVDVAVVHGDSMTPTLAPGTVVLVDRLPAHRRATAPGDLVVLTWPGDATRSIKRVIAVGGQSVAVRDGVVEVDGVPRAEPWVLRSEVDGVFFGPVAVPAGSVFVLGDHRDVSVDSRERGPVPLRRVVGVVLDL